MIKDTSFIVSAFPIIFLISPLRIGTRFLLSMQLTANRAFSHQHSITITNKKHSLRCECLDLLSVLYNSIMHTVLEYH